MCIHAKQLFLYLHQRISNSNTSPEMNIASPPPNVSTFFKLRLQKLFGIWEFGSALWSLGGQEEKNKKNPTTLGSGMHHCVDDVCGDRWQLKRACSRTVVSNSWLWYSLGLLGRCCCVLFNNPNPLSPPQPTSVLWLFLVFFITLYCNLIICAALLWCVAGEEKSNKCHKLCHWSRSDYKGHLLIHKDGRTAE